MESTTMDVDYAPEFEIEQVLEFTEMTPLNAVELSNQTIFVLRDWLSTVETCEKFSNQTKSEFQFQLWKLVEEFTLFKRMCSEFKSYENFFRSNEFEIMSGLFTQFTEFTIEFSPFLCTSQSSEEIYVQLTMFSQKYFRSLRFLRTINLDSASLMPRNHALLVELNESFNFTTFPENRAITLMTRLEKMFQLLTLLESTYNQSSTVTDDFLQSDFYFNTTTLQWEFFDFLTSYRNLTWNDSVLDQFSTGLSQFDQRTMQLLLLEEKLKVLNFVNTNQTELSINKYGPFAFSMISEIYNLTAEITSLKWDFSDSVEMITKMDKLERSLEILVEQVKTDKMNETQFAEYVTEKHSDLFHELSTFDKVLMVQNRTEVPQALTGFILRLSKYFSTETMTDESVMKDISNMTGEFKAGSVFNVTELETSTVGTVEVENTTMSALDDSNIQFEIKNYTVISHNGSVPNSYSLRIRIKGYKWRNQFQDVTSAESQALLKEKILPLLYKSLNLVPDEINEVKLLKLFRGRRDGAETSSELIDTDELDLQFDLTQSGAAEMTNSTTNLLTEPRFVLVYPLRIVALADAFDYKYLNNTIEQAVKEAVLHHYSNRLSQCQCSTIFNSANAAIQNASQPEYPIEMKLELVSSIELMSTDVSDSLIKLAVNKNQCELNNVNKTVDCGNKKRAIDSLLRISDLWVELEDKREPVEHKLMSLEDLFEFNSSWVFGLVIIACILALFFVGCIFAICYTRKPLAKRSGKIYDIDTKLHKEVSYNNKPSMYPTTKQHVIPKHKEVYY